MRKSKIISFLVLALATILLLVGCGSRWSSDRYIEISKQCIEEDGELLSEIHERRTNREGYSELSEYLMEKYQFREISHRIVSIDGDAIDYNRMEFWFEENYINRNYAIFYYPPGVELPEDSENFERTKEIGNGFYFYIEYVGL